MGSYHSLLSNALFVVLVAPFAYAMRPRRWTLVLTVIALLVWCLFGIGFTIDHM